MNWGLTDDMADGAFNCRFYGMDCAVGSAGRAIAPNCGFWFPGVVDVNARKAWALLAAGVLSYEVACRDGQLSHDSGSRASSRQRTTTGTV